MTHLEIRQMIQDLTREQLYSLFSRPRETVENELLPKAMSHHYTEKEMQALLAGVSTTHQGRAKFEELQKVQLADQRRRLVTLLEGGEITKAKRQPIPYQT